MFNRNLKTNAEQPLLPLHDQLILEIGGNISAPAATAELARAGAQVIKVEYENGDPARKYLSIEAFTNFNASKHSISLQKGNDQDRYTELLQNATVIVDNRSAEAKQRDHTLMNFINEDYKSQPVIYCSIVGYDHNEEHSQKRALDITVQAATGMAMTNAPSALTPLKVGFVVIDLVTGTHAASAIKEHIIAIKNKCIIPKEHKQVIFLEVSMARVSAMLQSGHYLNYLTKHIETYRHWNRDLFLSPFSFYKTKDGHIAIGIVSESQFNIFCTSVLKKPDLITRYATNKVRLEKIEEFESEINAILVKSTTQEVIHACHSANIPCSQINTIAQSISTFSRNFFFTETKAGTTVIKSPTQSSLYTEKLTAAPALGENKYNYLNYPRAKL